MEFISKNKYLLLIGGILLIFLVYPYLDRITFDPLDMETVFTDAIAIEDAGKAYCEENTCTENMDMTYELIKDYVTGFSNVELYDFEAYDGFVIKKIGEKYQVYLEPDGTGGFEFLPGHVPSESDLGVIGEDYD